MMYDDGLIYRGERIVNWCPRCHSTLSDDEVEHKETRSKLYYLRDRTGKKARIADRDRGQEADQYELAEVIEKVLDNKKHYSEFVLKRIEDELDIRIVAKKYANFIIKNSNAIS